MLVKMILDEDFVNYKLPSMFISFPTCTFKCDAENGNQICQNCKLAKEPDIDISRDDICTRYLLNPISKALVFGGLEPMDSLMDVVGLIDTLRRQYECNDPIVIYTGYTEEELEEGRLGGVFAQKTTSNKSLWNEIKKYPNIVVKFGRFIPDMEPHYDEVLGVKLASDNQYAKEISYENN